MTTDAFSQNVNVNKFSDFQVGIIEDLLMNIEQELLLKEALHIQMTPSEERFNWDGGLEVPGCWITVMRRQGGRNNPHRPLTSDDVYPQ